MYKTFSLSLVSKRAYVRVFESRESIKRTLSRSLISRERGIFFFKLKRATIPAIQILPFFGEAFPKNKNFSP